MDKHNFENITLEKQVIPFKTKKKNWIVNDAIEIYSFIFSAKICIIVLKTRWREHVPGVIWGRLGNSVENFPCKT